MDDSLDTSRDDDSVSIFSVGSGYGELPAFQYERILDQYRSPGDDSPAVGGGQPLPEYLESYRSESQAWESPRSLRLSIRPAGSNGSAYKMRAPGLDPRLPPFNDQSSGRRRRFLGGPCLFGALDWLVCGALDPEDLPPPPVGTTPKSPSDRWFPFRSSQNNSVFGN